MKKEKAKKKTSKKSNYFKEVRKELSKVKWPEKSEVLKYTITTVVFIVVVVLFFCLLNLGMSYLKGLFV